MMRAERTTDFRIKKKKKIIKKIILLYAEIIINCFCALLIIIFRKQKFTTNSTNSTSKTHTRHAHIHKYEIILHIVQCYDCIRFACHPLKGSVQIVYHLLKGSV